MKIINEGPINELPLKLNSSRYPSYKETPKSQSPMQQEKDGLHVENSRGEARSIKVQEVHGTWIEKYIEENPVITLAQIKSKLQADLDLTISISTVIRTIKRLNRPANPESANRK
ncbi:hypothetical protein RF11_00166 [Thelohanellus kitauei]|uniref:Uncharacterized protein n=1 Tax=Thelohanellus kitauei TaxID=669202 RepID=A0A0C2N8X6_THEKT|nr:hypothetical protein RF11_00166 [Thelohanellus kitauei]